MYDRFIVAANDEGQRAAWLAIAQEVRDELAPDADIVDCPNADQTHLIWRQNRKSRDLVIVEAELPAFEDSATAPSDSLGGGVELIDRLQEGPSIPACILVAPFEPRIFEKSLKWPLCQHVPPEDPTKADLYKVFQIAANNLAQRRDALKGDAELSARPCPPAPNWALLEVNLDSERSWVSLCIGNGNEVLDREDPASLDLDVRKLKTIVRDSRKLRDSLSARLNNPEALAGWQGEYQKLGQRVFDLIYKDDFPHFWGRASYATKDNVRLRFVLDNDSYDGLWESMYDRRTHGWLTLKGTIARRARVNANPPVRPLDGGDGKIHMLVISSDATPGSHMVGPRNPGFERLARALGAEMRTKHGRAARIEDMFPPLPELEDEMAALAGLQTAHQGKAEGPKLEIDFVHGSDGQTLYKRVKEKLTLGPKSDGRAHRYDVVHFAGHALFKDVGTVRSRGYLIFGHHDKETRAVPIAEFADWLKQAQVQLAYLNCCRSSAARAAYELANSEVPLAIGFTWDLESQGAVEFATTFYECLLNNDLKVCQAFSHARNQLHMVNGEDGPIWTAPVLVAQPRDWDKVETCFASG